MRRHRWAQTLNTHSGGQSRGMREWGWGWGAGSPAAPRAPGREAALSEAGARWSGAPAQRAVGRRASLPLVSLACGRGASWVSRQDSCRAGGAAWWPTAARPGSRARGIALQSSAQTILHLLGGDERKGAKTTIGCASASWSVKWHDNYIS